MLEYFVHLDPDDAPEDLILASADIPDNVSCERLQSTVLPPNWRETPAPLALAHFGDEFVGKEKTCCLIVPSALSPRENNWLLNPKHADFEKILILPTEPLAYDPRMFSRTQRRAHAARRRQKSV